MSGNVSKFKDGGIVIDFSEMNAVSVDPVKRVVKVPGGSKLKRLDYATQTFGLASSLPHRLPNILKGIRCNLRSRFGVGEMHWQQGLSLDVKSLD